MPHLPTKRSTTTATRALPYPVRAGTKENNTAMDGDNEDAPPAFGVAREPVVTEKHNTTTTASEAFIAASHLPILSWFSQGAAASIGIFAMFANLTGLIFLFYYFRTSCPRQYAILPNEWDAIGDTPQSITDLEATDGVTIISTYLIHYKADENFTQLGGTYWMPFAVTCGICEEECQLASCVGTTPISVEYNQCNAWGEVRAYHELIAFAVGVRSALLGMLGTPQLYSISFL